jgi:hypothetical protein
MAFAQVVVDDGFVTVMDQSLDHHAADVTGASCNQNFHNLNLSSGTKKARKTGAIAHRPYFAPVH